MLGAIVATMAGGRAWGRHRDLPPLRKIGAATMHTTYLQLALGVVAVVLIWAHARSTQIAPSEVLITSIHQGIGALLLAFASLLVIWTRRLLTSES